MFIHIRKGRTGKGKPSIKHTSLFEESGGTQGPASPIRRIDPSTGKVIEVIEAQPYVAPRNKHHRRDAAEKWLARHGASQKIRDLYTLVP